jgi:phage terminase large subunit-like protein
VSAEGKRIVKALEELEPAEMRGLLAQIPPAYLQALEEEWPAWAHEGQLPLKPEWRVWMLLGGRGFGKTRAGAEWVSEMARAHPGAQIALVAATPGEARRVMIDGPGGLLAVAREGEPARFEPSRGRLVFESGAEAFVYSAGNPESLRGPEHDFAWCDELAKWRKGAATWDNLMLGLRRGPRPRAIITTTPRPTALLRRIRGLPGYVETRGRTADNPHTAEDYRQNAYADYGASRLGRQELEGELLDDIQGALWTRDLIEKCRVGAKDGFAFLSEGGRRRIVIGVDPPLTADGDACGIVVCALGADGIAGILADLSVSGLSPDGWARRVAGAAQAWGAHRIVAEANNGGQMVESVLRGADTGLPVKLVHASDGKAARAEPVAALFEAGRAKFAGCFPELEDELCGLVTGGGFEGPGRSPDRADAMVWAMSELMLGKPRAEPRIRSF